MTAAAATSGGYRQTRAERRPKNRSSVARSPNEAISEPD